MEEKTKKLESILLIKETGSVIIRFTDGTKINAKSRFNLEEELENENVSVIFF